MSKKSHSFPACLDHGTRLFMMIMPCPYVAGRSSALFTLVTTSSLDLDTQLQLLFMKRHETPAQKSRSLPRLLCMTFAIYYLPLVILPTFSHISHLPDPGIHGGADSVNETRPRLRFRLRLGYFSLTLFFKMFSPRSICVLTANGCILQRTVAIL